MQGSVHLHGGARAGAADAQTRAPVDWQRELVGLSLMGCTKLLQLVVLDLLVLLATCRVSAAGMGGAPISAAGSTVGWQEHSKNDLRSWPQLKRKGGRNFKIDFNYRTPSFCKTQVRARNKSDPRGCFILNHDDPVPVLDTRPDYNTSDDVLDFLVENAARWFSDPGPQHGQ